MLVGSRCLQEWLPGAVPALNNAMGLRPTPVCTLCVRSSSWCSRPPVRASTCMAAQRNPWGQACTALAPTMSCMHPLNCQSQATLP